MVAPRLATASRYNLGEKLRRCASRARSGNPLSALPLTPPPAWVASTATLAYDMVVANGKWYVAIGPGTTAGSGTGPSHTQGIAADNDVNWSYVGAALITSSDADAPTLTLGASLPSSQSAQFLPTDEPTLYRTYGAAPEINGVNWKLAVFQSEVGVTDYGNGAKVGVDTDATKFTIRMPANSTPPRVIIDGRYYCLGGKGKNTAAQSYQTYDFSGRRKRRKIIFEGDRADWLFTGLFLIEDAQIWPVDAVDNVRAVFIGDSLFDGSAYGSFMAGNTPPNRISHLLGWSDPWNLSAGGTGWINTSFAATGLTRYTYVQRVAQALALNPEVVLFGPPTNDTASSAAAVTAAVVAAIAALRAGGFTGPIIIMGAWPRNDTLALPTEDAVAAGVTQAADSRTFFIPLYRTGRYPIVTGTWNNGNPTSISGIPFKTMMSNSGLAIGGDNVHPLEPGIALFDYVAEKIAADILPLL